MSLNLYNTLSRKKEPFVSIEDNKVKMYCCGPTVYNFAHIGNLRTYVFEDILRRILEYNGFEVKHVMNITDVGHLTDDADSGEDKMEKGAKREGKSVFEIAKFYTDAFLKDTENLNIKKPSIICKATDHIKEMIDMVLILEKKGYTYISEGNVYFDVSKFTYYKDLAKLDFQGMKSTERVKDDSEKRNPQDFVLWFTQSKFKNHAMTWDSPWGRGYPGWHIECSAMSTKYLGNEFDIHCGGVDHISVHHTNETAQSECSCGKHPWVKYWIHGEFLIMNEGKMSKSSGEFITLKYLTDRNFNPIIYRFFCLTAHYRQKLNFSIEALENAKNSYLSIKNKIASIKENIIKNKDNPEELDKKSEETITEFKELFLNAINDDLNMPKAIAILHDVLKSEISPGEKLTLIEDFDSIFGLKLLDTNDLNEEELNSINEIVEERKIAREQKNWKKSDELRNKISEMGFIVKDTPNGQIIERK